MAARLTLKQAIDDLGWFWGVFTSVVNAPSILSLLQMVFEQRFVDSLQWIVDGYNDIVGQLADVVEPWLQPLIAQINALLGWRLELQPHWQLLLMLALIPATSIARQVWRPKSGGNLIEPVAIGLGALFGVLAAGFVPLENGWWAEGLVAALPVSAALLFAEIAARVENVFKAPINRQPVGALLTSVLIFGAAAFALGAGLSYVPSIAQGAGLIALGLMVVALGCLSLASGLDEGETDATRMGLTMLGAFVAAGLIYAADALLKIVT